MGWCYTPWQNMRHTFIKIRTSMRSVGSWNSWGITASLFASPLFKALRDCPRDKVSMFVLMPLSPLRLALLGVRSIARIRCLLAMAWHSGAGIAYYHRNWSSARLRSRTWSRCPCIAGDFAAVPVSAPALSRPPTDCGSTAALVRNRRLCASRLRCQLGFCMGVLCRIFQCSRHSYSKCLLGTMMF